MLPFVLNSLISGNLLAINFKSLSFQQICIRAKLNYTQIYRYYKTYIHSHTESLILMHDRKTQKPL